MLCDSPQLLFPKDGSDRVSVEACGLCLSCCREKDEIERQRRLFWLKRKRGSYA